MGKKMGGLEIFVNAKGGPGVLAELWSGTSKKIGKFSNFSPIPPAPIPVPISKEWSLST